jgi:nucleoside-diphosphate-sugar epimerase
MKILVIGGSGFIGTALVRRLIELGYETSIFDKNPSGYFNHLVTIGDVRDKEALNRAIKGFDVIFNLAAEHRDDVTPKSLYMEVNVGGAENVCNAADDNGVRKIIFTSSVAVYGFTEKETDESGELKPFNDYGKTKLQAEKVYYRWQQKGDDRSLVIIRPTVVIGEGNRGNVYNLLRQIVSGNFVMVGKGHNIKSIAYVENVAAFLVHALSFTTGYHLFNYADKPDFDMNTLVSMVNRKMGRRSGAGVRLPYWIGYLGGLCFDVAAKITGKKFHISAVRMKKFCANTQFISSSINETGFVPPFTLSEGLERTIQYEFINPRKDDAVVFYTE